MDKYDYILIFLSVIVVAIVVSLFFQMGFATIVGLLGVAIVGVALFVTPPMPDTS